MPGSSYFDPQAYVQQQAQQASPSPAATSGGTGQTTLSSYDTLPSTNPPSSLGNPPSNLGDSATAQYYLGLNSPSGLNTAIARSVGSGYGSGSLGDPGSTASLLESTAGHQQQQQPAAVPGSSGLSTAIGQVTAVPPGAARDTISQIAAQLGIPPALAIAMAQQESGLNPNAVGDNGTSFGLYQLHQGGELGSYSPGQVSGAGGMALNARTALGELAGVLHAHPGMDPGAAAALAQRPANQAAYAAAIDALLRQGY